MMTKNEFVGILEQAKTEGEQLIPLMIPDESYDVAVSIEFNAYHGKHFYDISIDAYRDGEPIAIDARLLIGEDLMGEAMNDLDDQSFENIVMRMAAAMTESVEKDEEEVPAE